jgi:hypothetical protein
MINPGPKDYLKVGDWNAFCDVCGFKFKSSELRKRWDNLMVCAEDFEMRHPQDLIKSIPEKPAPPFSRPRNQGDSPLLPVTFTSPMVDNAGNTYFIDFGPADKSKL